MDDFAKSGKLLFLEASTVSLDHNVFRETTRFACRESRMPLTNKSLNMILVSLTMIKRRAGRTRRASGPRRSNKAFKRRWQSTLRVAGGKSFSPMRGRCMVSVLMSQKCVGFY